MGLILPGGPSWAYCSHNLSAVLATGVSVFGTQVTSGTASADGTAVTLLSALAHDAEYLQLRFGSVAGASSIDNNALMDILIDPAGGTSWSVLIPSLAVAGLTNPFTTANPPSGISGGYDFPIWIPAGASIGARARAAGASAIVFSVAAYAHGGNANPASWWAGQRVSAVGIDAANSRGASVTPGGSGSFGSWADFGSTLGEACGAVQWAVLGEHTFSSNWSNRGYQFEFGVGSTRFGQPFDRTIASTGTRGWWIPTGPIFHRFAAGTQFQARGKSSGVAIAMSVAGYAVH